MSDPNPRTHPGHAHGPLFTDHHATDPHTHEQDPDGTLRFTYCREAPDPPPAGIDVERLAEAMRAVTETEPGRIADADMHNAGSAVRWAAEAIADAYRARLAPQPTERDRLIADIRRMLPIVRIGHPELADEIERAMTLVEAS